MMHHNGNDLLKDYFFNLDKDNDGFITKDEFIYYQQKIKIR